MQIFFSLFKLFFRPLILAKGRDFGTVFENPRKYLLLELIFKQQDLDDQKLTWDLLTYIFLRKAKTNIFPTIGNTLKV